MPCAFHRPAARIPCAACSVAEPHPPPPPIPPQGGAGRVALVIVDGLLVGDLMFVVGAVVVFLTAGARAIARRTTRRPPFPRRLEHDQA